MTESLTERWEREERASRRDRRMIIKKCNFCGGNYLSDQRKKRKFCLPSCGPTARKKIPVHRLGR